MRSLQPLINWLGAGRFALLALALAGSALGGIALQITARDADWLLSAQLALIWLFFLVLALVLYTRLRGDGRQRLLVALGPGLGFLGLGVLLPDWALFFGGGGLGWIVSAQLVLRSRVRMEYQAAVRHMRRAQYNDAAAIMQRLIEAEPEDANHYRFRAEIYRLANQPKRAEADYRRVIELQPDEHTGYTGLAEVFAQQRKFDQAREYAQQAQAHAPGLWLTSYNLGLALDRLGDAHETVAALTQALNQGLPHPRYRLLAHLWLARAYARLGDENAARQHLAHLREAGRGAQDWEQILASEQAAALRALVESDIRLAQRVLAGEIEFGALADS